MRFNGKKFLQIMQDIGTTPKEVCIKTGLHITSLNFILENGFASEDAMERLAGAVGVYLEELTLPDISGLEENAIEFAKDGKLATVTFSQGRYKGRIRKLAKSHPEECEIVAENKDGSLCAHIPVKWIKIGPIAKRAESQREAARQNMLKMRQAAT